MGAQNLRAAFVAVALADVRDLLADHRALLFFGGQQRFQLADLLQHLVVVVYQAILLQRRQAAQVHVQNRLRLLRRKVVQALVVDAELRPQALRPHAAEARSRQQRLDGLGLPGAAHQRRAGIRWRRRGADQHHHRVDVLQRHRLAFEQVAAAAGAAQQEGGAAHHHFQPVLEEGIQHVAQIDGARLSIHQRHAIDAERALQLGERIQIVQHHFAVFAAPQFDHHAVAVLVRFVADLGYALHPLFLHQFGDLLDHLRLVHLVGNLGNDDGFLAAADAFHLCPGADQNAPAAGAIRLHDASAAVDDRAGGEIRALDVRHQLVHGELRVVEQLETRRGDFGEVVGRDVGGHPDGDAVGAVHQQVRHLGGQHRGDLQGFVVVGNRIYGFLVQIGQQLRRHRRHAHFRVALMRRGVAVYGAEVALAVHQQIAHEEILRHAHDGLVDGAVAVRVVLGHHLAHHVGGFAVRPGVGDAEIVHRVQHPAMHGLQAVAHVRQRPAHDHAHGVVEVGLAQLLLDAAREDVPLRRAWLIGQIRGARAGV